VSELIAVANDAGGPDNIGAVIIDCQTGPVRAVPRDVPAPPAAIYEMARRAIASSDPELLILGIEDLDLVRAADSASDDLLRALEQLIDKAK
jgi:hypothetical protein